MKFEIGCTSCGAINRSSVPIPSKNDGVDFTCWNCEGMLLTFYSDEHFMGKAIQSYIEKRNQSKVIKK